MNHNGIRPGTNMSSGTGPSALFLSFLLHGNLPQYDTSVHGPHNDSILHNRLSEARASESLYPIFRRHEDFTAHFASCGYSRQALPVNVLYDILARPGADTGDLGKKRIKWAKGAGVQHICVGKEVGGHWASVESGKALSYAEMLGLPCVDTAKTMGVDPYGRPSRNAVKKYLESYPRSAAIDDSVYGGIDILNIKRENSGFRIRIRAAGRQHSIYARNLVLATGVSQKPIPPPAELLDIRSTTDAPTIVVGTGFSAADEVLQCLAEGKPVIHVFKWKTAQSQPLKSCHPQAYPEYTKVWRLMKGRIKDPLYEGMPDGTVRKDDVGVRIEFVDGRPACSRQASDLRFYIGRCSSLDYLDDRLREEIGADGMIRLKTLRERCEENVELAPNVFVVGSLTGDSLIKFIGGVCMNVASVLLERQEQRKSVVSRIQAAAPRSRSEVGCAIS